MSPEEIAVVLVPKVQDAVIRAITGDLTKLATDVFQNLSSATGSAGDKVKGVADGLQILFEK